VIANQRRAWLFGAAVVILGVALVINRTTGKPGVSVSAQRSALIAKANLPDCPTVTGRGAVASGLPSMTFPCLGNGPKVDLAKLRGPLVVNIWAGTCVECRQEAPQLRAFATAASGKVGVLGVVDGAYNNSETWDDALDASRGLGLAYPSVFDATGRFVTWTRAVGIPVSLLVRSDGTVAYRKVGVLRQGELEQLVKQHLGIEVAS
jgi:thiol-disulfide isomerase/thioredoxin